MLRQTVLTFLWLWLALMLALLMVICYVPSAMFWPALGNVIDQAFQYCLGKAAE